MMERAFSIREMAGQNRIRRGTGNIFRGRWQGSALGSGDHLRCFRTARRRRHVSPFTNAWIVRHLLRSARPVRKLAGPHLGPPPTVSLPSAMLLDGGWTVAILPLLGIAKLNQYGPIVNVDKRPRLMAHAPADHRCRCRWRCQRAHSSVEPGKSAPKDAQGKFLHEDVWRYLLHPPGRRDWPAGAARSRLPQGLARHGEEACKINYAANALPLSPRPRLLGLWPRRDLPPTRSPHRHPEKSSRDRSFPRRKSTFREPRREYVEHNSDGWHIFVERELADDHPDLAETALERVENKLMKCRSVRAGARSLHRVPLFLLLARNPGGRTR